jgi:three-Cys-motif partner protein
MACAVESSPMVDKGFFAERSDESEVKARIVEKYFDAWGRVMVAVAKKSGRNRKLAYIDLYAGPGRYQDGSASTPLLVLQRAIANPDLCAMLATLFNDMDEDNSHTLANEIAKLPGIERLKHKPVVFNDEVGPEAAEYFNSVRLVPTFSFVDPWGYKSLSKRIINGFIKDWGCDCVFFFNYRRINAAFSNPLFKSHIDALFGEDRASRVREQLDGLLPHEREALILEELGQSLKGMGGRYVLPFLFKSDSGTRTTHCLVFVSKGEKGLEIMKEIMAKESSVADQGVPSFAYSPADYRMPLLFSLARPLDALEEMLLERFAGRTLTMDQIYHSHHANYRYIRKNYRDALLKLEAEGKITTATTKKKRPAGTFGPDIHVTFPPRNR